MNIRYPIYEGVYRILTKKQGKRKRSHSGFRAFNMERKKTIRQSVRME